MKTKNSEMLVNLVRIKRQVGNVDLYHSILFDYDQTIEMLDDCIEISKSNVVSEFKKIEMRGER